MIQLLLNNIYILRRFRVRMRQGSLNRMSIELHTYQLELKHMESDELVQEHKHAAAVKRLELELKPS